VDFLLLGPLEARHREGALRLGSIKHRMLLAKLLLHPNQVVSTDELIDTVWGEEPPPTVRQSLQNHVAALRKAIEPGAHPPRMLLTRDPGYLLEVDPDQLDLHRFQQLVGQGRWALAGGDAAAATAALRAALSLWRGPVLADVAAAADTAWPELVGVDELRVAAVEARVEADLALGRHQELVGELEALTSAHPLREHLHGQLMLALYRSGRQADALAAYREARRTLVGELGIEPSLGLQRLEQAILAQDPALELLAPVRAADDPVAGDAEERPPAHGQARGEPPGPTERKLVTVLFADVDEPVGEAGERDPEDVSSMLERHLERVRAEVASFGGTVEHTIGGTTMAVFGVPHTREDDPERAVRAALAIRDALAGGGPGVVLRVSVTSGEALVTAGAGRVSGDLVSTCARLQQAAPVGTVLVSEATERATRRTISYGPASLLSLPGRARPVTVWSALEPRGQAGPDAVAAGPVPLVGRAEELRVLAGAFERAQATCNPQLVTLTGPPGIGKSRLVAELGRQLEADRDRIAWRQGRSPSYGDGATFWALGEIVKAEAGILATDTDERAGHKLAQAVGHAMADDPAGAPWVTGHLRLLVGAASAEPLQAGRQEEAFAAWRRFLDGIAAHRPLVLVVEDLHWADDALLDFVESLLDPVADPGRTATLLVLATTRPELSERRPAWGSHPTAATIDLEPLSQADTTCLLDALLAHHRLAGAVGPDLLARVGGNPLFAEEYVRMLRDRGGVAGEAVAAPPAASLPAPPALPLPETVHAIIAARLDTLPADEKAVLQDAAVLGRTGWVGALAAVGGHERALLEARLEQLERKEFLYRAGRSSVAGEREYSFRHVLVREVAYGQIPRAERAERHRKAAAWLESLTADRVEGRAAGRAELLAHHYRQALDFARAAGRGDAELAERARLALRDAGDRVTALGVHAQAARYYGQALELWPAGGPGRAELEFRAGKAQLLGEGGGHDLLTRGRDGLLAAGARERAAEAEVLLAQLAYLHGRGRRAAHVDRALELVADAPASASKAAVLEGCMMHLMVAERHAEALEVAREALAMAEALGLRDVEAATLGAIAVAKVTGGDAGGIADLERSIAIYERLGSSTSVNWKANLAFSYAILGDLASSFAARAEAWRAAERLRLVRELRWIELARVAEQYWTGHWDWAVATVDALVAESTGGARHQLESACRIWRGRILLARGDLEAALLDAGQALELARESGDPQDLDPALAFAARVLLAAERPDEAGRLVAELLPRLDHGLLKPDLGVDLGVDLAALGHPAEVLDGALPSRWLEAAQAFVAGDARRAAAVYEAIGSRPDAAYARLEAARTHPDGGGAELELALAFFRQVGAHAYLEQAGALVCTPA
jgi:DNA-binding SARP family transcriptional activator